MKPFAELTVRGKARRLRPIAMNALRHYAFDVDRLELIRNDLNGIFRVRSTEGTSYLLRVCLPGHHDLSTIQSEVIWLQALEDDPDIQALRPIPTRNDEFVVTASDPGVPEPRRCVVFSWLPGRDLQSAGGPDEFAKLGRLMALMHRQAASWSPPDRFQIRTLNLLYPFGRSNRIARSGAP